MLSSAEYRKTVHVEEQNANNRFAVPLPQLDLIHFPSLLGEGAR